MYDIELAFFSILFSIRDCAHSIERASVIVSLRCNMQSFLCFQRWANFIAFTKTILNSPAFL